LETRKEINMTDIQGGSRIARFGLPPSAYGYGPQAQFLAPPPTQFPPPNSVHFRLVGWNDFVGAGENSPADLQFQIPAGRLGVIDFITFYCNDMVATTDIRLSVRVNNIAIPGFSRLRMFPRASGFVGTVDSALGIEVPEGARISVLLEHIDAGNNRVGASVGGWAYPKPAAQ
jgi:hypothetical protein